MRSLGPVSTSTIPITLKGLCGLALCGLLARAALASELGLTIYNQNFAVVRDTVSLDLKHGSNYVRFAGATAFLEPSSVVLRDPSGKHAFQILEQNYRGDPVSQEMLLTLNEGKTIQFEPASPDGAQGRREIIRGRIVRSGAYDPRVQGYAFPGNTAWQPIIEVDGQLRFGLPGQPLFPALADNTILRPTLVWVIESPAAARFDAELSYITGELQWAADYNLVLPEQGDLMDLTGWVTINNQSGKAFERARIELMAGDVSKIIPSRVQRLPLAYYGGAAWGGAPSRPPVTEKAFDEYHLYTLERPTTLLDREQKQVEFVRADGIRSQALYIYDGASTELGEEWVPDHCYTEPGFRTAANKRIWVIRQFTNSVANHLGLPLPKGQLRVYRRNGPGQLEFTGEDLIKHTPRDEVIRLVTGMAFDLVGERKRTEFQIHEPGGVTVDPATGLPLAQAAPPTPPFINESFEITLRNHKRTDVTIRVVEHLYRWVTWEITRKSDEFRKTDAQSIEFRVSLKPDETRTIRYTVHYTW